MAEFGTRHPEQKSQGTIAEDGIEENNPQRFPVSVNVGVKERLEAKGFRDHVDVISLSVTQGPALHNHEISLKDSHMIKLDESPINRLE